MFLNSFGPLSLGKQCGRLASNKGVINILVRQCSTGSFLQYEKDPAPYFIQDKVQKLLKSLTGIQFERVFKKRAVDEYKVQFKFMTTEQFEQEIQNAANKAKRYLQMPPIVKVHEDQPATLSKDTLLDGFSDSSYVITDITFGVKDSKRTVLVRQPDGTLQTAPYDVRKRICQVYFPRSNRKIATPKMFDAEYLQKLLDAHEYEFILDRACIQFEPYEKEFHEITSKTYQHLNSTKMFDVLRSTRHFGGMAFFLAWHKMIDDLLLDCIKREYLRNGVELILLHHKLHALPEEAKIEDVLKKHPDTTDIVKDYCRTMLSGHHEELHNKIDYEDNSADAKLADTFLELIEKYTKTYGVKKVQLELAIQTYKEEMDRRNTSKQRVAS